MKQKREQPVHSDRCLMKARWSVSVRYNSEKRSRISKTVSASTTLACVMKQGGRSKVSFVFWRCGPVHAAACESTRNELDQFKD